MGVSHLVAPLDSGMLDWARECGVEIRDALPTGRAATFDQLLDVVKKMPGHSFTFQRQEEKFWISVESEKRVTFRRTNPWTVRNSIGPGLAEIPATETTINGAIGDDGAIKWMSFHGSSELLVACVRQLTRACGPQTIFADYDGRPWLVLSPDAVPVGPEPWYGKLPNFVLPAPEN